MKRTIILRLSQQYYKTFHKQRPSGNSPVMCRLLPACHDAFFHRGLVRHTASFLFALLVFLDSSGQSGITDDLKKPEKYENRPLGYEKTDQTKFKIPRHFIQNTVTHYNYYFNANNKINEILARAKAQNRDDYTQLLPFYDYSLDVTARDKKDLDSIIDKVNTGILVHDLRNDWVDNLYMLMGRAYYYEKNFDTAYMTFQFVNFAFAPKEKDGYDKPIGSNANASEGGSALIISTNEKRNIVKKIFNLPPSRNEALIWQIRTFLAQDELIRAASLIEILKRDPQFPARLQPQLQEMQALWFYQQNIYDSAAVHLDKALDNTDGKLERARREYLIAQLYERAGNRELAKFFYEKVAQHTYDPVMDVYARLNAIRQNRQNSGGEDYIQKNIEALQKLARKEIYFNYRDVIYYAAAQMELERNDKSAAIGFLLRSTRSALPNSQQRDKAFLLLGSLSLEQKKYKEAKNYYDSVNVSNPEIADSLQPLQDRKKALARIVMQLLIIERQDSLQRIALMPQNERDAYIKKLLRALRKQHGLTEDEQTAGGNASFKNNNAAPSDMFGNGSTGDWYFYNTSLKAKGFSEFKSKWGNRPNVDNWQVSSMMARQKVPNSEPRQGEASENNPAQQQSAASLNVTALLANLPLTPEKMNKSKDSVEHALFSLGKLYQDYIPDYISAIGTYDSLLDRFPSTRFFEETLFNLYYCYKKLGDETDAARVLQMMQQKYPKGKYTGIINNPNADPEKEERTKATAEYEKIYSDFIEGNFEQALAEKKAADSLYGGRYWTAQLLYIEAVYYVHRREDSLAKVELTNIERKYAGTPIAAKAKNMLDVLTRRKQLETYLTNLKIQRSGEDSSSLANNGGIPAANNATDSMAANKTMTDSARLARQKQKTDTARATRSVPKISSAFTFAPARSHAVVIVLNKVDPVYFNETKNAFDRYNKETYYNKTFDITNISLDDSTKLVVINGFDSAGTALDYMQKAQKLAPGEIIPWLPRAKYSFLIVSDQNLEVLRNNKDMAAYKKFLNAYFPGKF